MNVSLQIYWPRANIKKWRLELGKSTLCHKWVKILLLAWQLKTNRFYFYAKHSLLKFKWIRNPFYLTSIFISNPLLHVFSVETKIIVIVLFSGLVLPTFFPMARIFLLLLRFFVRRKKNRKSGCGRFPELHFPDLCQSRRCRLVDSDSSPALPYSISAIN